VTSVVSKSETGRQHVACNSYGDDNNSSANVAVMMSAANDILIGDNIATIDCSVFWHRLGVSWPECNRLWLVKDVCGIICAVFTWLLIIYAEFVVVVVILLPSHDSVHSIINATVFHFFTLLAVASHLRTMLTDPVMPFFLLVLDLQLDQ